MRESSGEESVLTGSSVHNQRIERFNRDLNNNCSHVYSPIFYELESMNVLDLDNETDIFSLHYVYIPGINGTLDELTIIQCPQRKTEPLCSFSHWTAIC